MTSLLNDPTKSLPCAPDIEVATLSAILASPTSCLPYLKERGVGAKHFYNPGHATIWRSILRLEADGKPIQDATVATDLMEAGRMDLIGEIAALRGGEPVNIDHYADVLIDKLARRDACQAAEATYRAAVNESAPLATALHAPLERLVRLKDGSASTDGPRITTKSLGACVLSADALEALEIPRRPRLLDDWLCQGDLGYIFAPRGVGKTWMAMSVPNAIAGGTSLGEWSAGDFRAKVLYIDGEMPLELTRARNRSLAISGVSYLHHDRIFELLESSLNIAHASHQSAITEVIIGGGFDCVVLDNLSCLASGMDENNGQDHESISGWLLELRRRKITVIMIHHAGRSGAMRGHSKREDATSWILELRDAKVDGEDGAKFISHFAKRSRNTSQAMPDLLWHFQTPESGITEVTCTPAEVEDFEKFVQHVGDGVDCAKDIADLMEKPKGTVSKWVKRALDSGRITRSGNVLKPTAA